MNGDAVHGTEYLVLEKRVAEGPNESAVLSGMAAWVERETRFARSARDAISGYVRENGERPGTYAAVPTRSFSQKTVGVETQTRLTFT